MEAINPQKQHYEEIGSRYASHYYDATSMQYRRRFIFSALLAGLDLNGKAVADLASGDGYNSLELKALYPKIELQGFDISPSACAAYQQLVGAPAIECDLIRGTGIKDRFDAAIIVGGLHHLVADFSTAIHNITSMLKPGGLLLAVEPNKRFFLNGLREWWYRHDRYFEATTERPIDVREVADADRRLTFERVHYFGGPAYFLILNSLILRVPLGLKKPLIPSLMAFESVYQRLPGSKPFPAFAAAWRRSAS